MNDLIKIDLIDVEDWREYDFIGRVYRINKPKAVYFRNGGTTHRIEDAEGIFHCVPSPGSFGCVLRWQGRIIA